MHLNFNVGLVGHVDSGKTSLAKVLSCVASTAAFDKSKQSQDRGITLDLGFSSFKVPMPDHLKDKTDLPTLQYTLVDCPGHAALIRTIIGGAQIVDMLLLVVDATKGIQTQTGECIVIGELTCSRMIVVLNKIELIPQENRPKTLEKLTKRLKHALEGTSFKNCPFVNIAANPANGNPIGIDELISVMTSYTYMPVRNKEGPFFMAVDHCFNVSGRGTVLTGTIIQGQVRVKEEIHFPAINLTRNVKSIQVYREDLLQAEVGDRIGLCVSKFDTKLMERGVICTKNYAIRSYAIIMPVRKIVHFKLPVNTGSKFHVSVGHETSMATVTFFSVAKNLVTEENQFNCDLEYKYCEELPDDDSSNNETYFALLEFGKTVYTMPRSLIIGSKLDMDVHTNSCRIAFSGYMLLPLGMSSYKTEVLPRIKVFKTKHKEGVLDRIVSENEIIVKGMFQKESNTDIFNGLKVSLSSGETGIIGGHFGQTGKIKVLIDDSLKKETMDSFGNRKRKNSGDTENNECIKVTLEFKSYIYNKNCKLKQ